MEFIIAILIGATGVALYSLHRYSVVRNWKDWAVAAAVIGGVMFALSTAARADAFQYTELFFGLEVPNSNGHPACVEGDDQLTSNIGINQHLYSWNNTRIEATYRHHSCAVGDDDRVSDTVGLNAVWRLQW